MRTILTMALCLATAPLGAQQGQPANDTESHYLVFGSAVVPLGQLEDLTNAMPLLQVARGTNAADDLRVPIDAALVGLDVSIDYGSYAADESVGTPPLTMRTTPAFISIAVPGSASLGGTEAVGMTTPAPASIGLLVTVSQIPVINVHSVPGATTGQQFAPISDFVLGGSSQSGSVLRKTVSATRGGPNYCEYVVTKIDTGPCTGVAAGFGVGSVVCISCINGKCLVTSLKRVKLRLHFASCSSTELCTVIADRNTSCQNRCQGTHFAYCPG